MAQIYTQFGHSIRYRLLAETHHPNGPSTRNCRGRRSFVDTFGDHDQKSGLDNQLRFNTHSQLSKDIANSANYATQGVKQIESTNCYRLGSPHSNERLDVKVKPYPTRSGVPERMAEKKATVKKRHHTSLCGCHH